MSAWHLISQDYDKLEGDRSIMRLAGDLQGDQTAVANELPKPVGTWKPRFAINEWSRVGVFVFVSISILVEC